MSSFGYGAFFSLPQLIQISYFGPSRR